MIKKLIGLAAAVALLVSFPATAHAEDFTGDDGWGVTFDGSRMTSTFKNTDIDDAVYKLQPGDKVTIHLTLSNDYNADTDWYMTNEVLKSLEDSQTVAEGGAYSYILTYVNPKGESTPLYNSESVGGEDTTAGEGLHQATDSMEDYFYLDTLAARETGEITLTVKLEGETQGNAYQDTLAKLQMNFAVELTQAAKTPKKPATGTPVRTLGRTSVKTGDTNKVLYLSIAALVAGAACAGAAIYKIRKAGRDKKERRPK